MKLRGHAAQALADAGRLPLAPSPPAALEQLADHGRLAAVAAAEDAILVVAVGDVVQAVPHRHAAAGRPGRGRARRGAGWRETRLRPRPAAWSV